MFELVDSKITDDFKETISVERWWLKLENREVVGREGMMTNWRQRVLNTLSTCVLRGKNQKG